ncbi:hypothetical protein [Nitrosospira multiformis]|uniref:Uncharacterized protein n=1 Tax=Nitrosospira multiformis TaxID=1231 RepID=A0A1I7I5U7_9PROT|nr:hypothetical protein [Nitrosospira multiformis]SFU68116.1 hypothetical protein SAMN05216417_11472 [Nitrosospira multiformis]
MNSSSKAEVTFTSDDGKEVGLTLHVTGISPEILKQGDKIQKIMDILELPPGTNARLLYQADDVIVR